MLSCFVQRNSALDGKAKSDQSIGVSGRFSAVVGPEGSSVAVFGVFAVCVVAGGGFSLDLQLPKSKSKHKPAIFDTRSLLRMTSFLGSWVPMACSPDLGLDRA